MTTSGIVLITLIAYKLALIGIGLWASSRNRDETDFFLGGRGLGPWVAGLSYAASTSSAWVLLGFSGFVYAVGLPALWMLPGIWGGYILMWLVLGPRLQAESARHGHLTLTDFLLQDARGAGRREAALLAAAMILFCFIFYIAAQFDATGRALTEHFPISTTQAVMLGAAIVLMYSVLGGFWAVSLTDTLQGMVMAVIALGLPLVALVAAGGPGELFQELARTTDEAYLSWGGQQGVLLFIGFVVGTIGIGLGTLGQPQLTSRLMAIRDTRARLQGFAVAMGWGVLVFSGMAVLGLSGRALLPELASGEALFYAASASLLPPVLAGVVIAATLSAVMSTVDSILLAASAAVAHDTGLVRRMPGREVLTSRLVMVTIAAAAVVLTLILPDSIFNRVLFAWAALGAAFGPILVARISHRRPSGRLAAAAMATGFAGTVLFYSLGTLPADGGFLTRLAHLPGDPFERVFPWLVPMLLLFSLAPVAGVEDGVRERAGASDGEPGRR